LFFNKKTYQSGASPSILAWQRFRKNKMAMAFVFLIIVAVLVSILGYLITPDNTPYANEQFLEFTTQKPGFNANILLLTKNETQPKVSMLNKMLFGQKNPYFSIPYSDYFFENDEIVLRFYTDNDTINAVTKRFKLVDVVYPLSVSNNSYKIIKNRVTFFNYDNVEKSANIDSLKNVIQKKHLVKKIFLLGTDKFGRDVLSQIIIGTRVSLSVGFISVIISLVIGIFLGAIAGYYKGWVDNLIVWFINVVWSIPTLLLVIAITFALGKGFWQIFIAVGLTMWVEVARVVRGQVLSIREKEYVEATKALGYSNFRIIFKHILPNVISPVIVISAANFASAILIEAGLSFLGIGVQPPMPSWGTMIKEHYSYIILDKAFLAVFPGIAIMLMVMAFMIIGNGLRDALDVKTVNKQ